MTLRQSVVAFVLAAGLGACGAESSQKPAASPPADEEQKKVEPGSFATPEQPYPQGPAPAATMPTFAPAPPEPAVGGDAAAENELEVAEQDLQTALSSGGADCRTGCKAFGSMQRARDRICEINQPGDPGGRCQNARRRCDDAERRLRGGSCSC